MSRHSQEARRAQIRRSISSLARGRQRRYSTKQRRMIGAYARERIAGGSSRAQISKEIGVSDPTLVRLLEQDNAASGRLRPVRIVEEPGPIAEAGSAMTTPVVRGPAGIVIEGLDIASIAALVRALS